MANDTFITLMAIIAASFVAAFASGIQQKANKKQMTIMQMTGEILVHAVSGIILGLITTKIANDILTLCALAGIGGLVGQKVVYFVCGFIKVALASAKKVDLKQVNEEAKELEEQSKGKEEQSKGED